jgi:2-amino-4-hydroxy-6-hydroxymethyldihydropteridine diphosphokinase
LELYLLTGSNLHNPLYQLSKAKQSLEAEFGAVVKYSSIYKTAPWGNPNQPDFYNQVLVFETDQAPQAALDAILKIELEMGRVRSAKWEPRVIDIDILFMGKTIYESSDLQIPHPHIASRRFVLEPMAEVAQDFLHPQLQQTMKYLLSVCEDTCLVEKM